MEGIYQKWGVYILYGVSISHWCIIYITNSVMNVVSTKGDKANHSYENTL